MPRDEFTAEAFFKGFTEGWTAAGGDEAIGSCPVPEPHFDEVEYLIDQVCYVKTRLRLDGVFSCARLVSTLVRLALKTFGAFDFRLGSSSRAFLCRDGRTRGIPGDPIERDVLAARVSLPTALTFPLASSSQVPRRMRSGLGVVECLILLPVCLIQALIRWARNVE